MAGRLGAEIIQIRDYQTREELDLILLRSISRSLGFEWASDERYGDSPALLAMRGIVSPGAPEGDEFVGPDGDCA